MDDNRLDDEVFRVRPPGRRRLRLLRFGLGELISLYRCYDIDILHGRGAIRKLLWSLSLCAYVGFLRSTCRNSYVVGLGRYVGFLGAWSLWPLVSVTKKCEGSTR